jgi:NTP pyrophosphatase (non-canonical NTP hydrolase)
MNPELIINKIRAERKRQDEKWGEQNHHPLMWFSIIGEEFGEMCKAFNEYSFEHDPNHIEDMQREAIQVAACCVAMVECLERQAEKGLTP